MQKTISLFILVAIFSATSFGRELSLTIYNDNFALIKDTRIIDLQAGVTEYRFTDVAVSIEPTSVRFRSLDDANTRLVEQNFQFDLISSVKLMNKYVGKDIELMTQKGELIVGVLLKAEGNQIIVKTKDGLKIITSKQISAVKLSKLPKGLITRPTLVWQIYSSKKGRQKVQLDYLANKIGWKVNYNAELSADDKLMSLIGWVTITNNSGTDFPDAHVALIAGELNREEVSRFSSGVDYLRTISRFKPSNKRGNEQSESFGEYRLYRLPIKTSLDNNQIKQIRLIQADNIPVKKIYLYDGAKVRFYPYRTYFAPEFGREYNTKVNVIVSLKNRADNNLGVALPKGLIRIFKRDKDGSLEFVGEDKVPSTSVNEKLLIYIGDAFDITGKRVQADFKRISKYTIEEAFEITLKNHKSEPVTISVIEKLYRWSNWRILQASDKYDKINSRTIKFDVLVEPDEERKLTYRVRYEL